MKAIQTTAAQADLIRRTFGLGPREPAPTLTAVPGGLTNSSFRFFCRGEDCLIREPGADSFTYINRFQEAEAYAAVAGRIPTDELLALEPETGRKITRFWEGARCADPERPEEVARCMGILRQLHDGKFQVSCRYSVFDLSRVFIQWKTPPSRYPDYDLVERRCMDMEPVLEPYRRYEVLSHCDTVLSNFLFRPDGELRLIDWEYSGMHDPLVDVAMFANDGNYMPAGTDRLLTIYLGRAPTAEERLRTYGYLAVIGLAYSNWEERERLAGRDWGAYGRQQYDHASRYSGLFWELLQEVQKEAGHGAG